MQQAGLMLEERSAAYFLAISQVLYAFGTTKSPFCRNDGLLMTLLKWCLRRLYL